MQEYRNRSDQESSTGGEDYAAAIGFSGTYRCCGFDGLRARRKGESDGVGSSIPYESIGQLEVHIPARAVPASKALWGGVELLTLTFAKTPSRAEIYKSQLRDKLAEVAQENYGAHAVVNVEYWPDPDSDKFPEGKVYARGQMIKYRRFS